MTNVLLPCPADINPFATERAYTKPAHTACTSNANALCAPSFSWTIVAVDGKVQSGVVVATIIQSISDILSPDDSKA